MQYLSLLSFFVFLSESCSCKFSNEMRACRWLQHYFFFLWENELIFSRPGRKCIISELKCAKWHLQKTVEFLVITLGVVTLKLKLS